MWHLSRTTTDIPGCGGRRACREGTAALVIDDAEDPAVSPDGTRLAFVRANHLGQPRIAVASLPDANDARFLTGDGPEFGFWEHRDPAWSPNGRNICYRGQRDLFIVGVPATGLGAPAKLTKDDARDEDPVWSSDGRFVLFSSLRENTSALWSVPATGGAAKRVTLGAGPERHPTVSRDGNTLVYSAALGNPNIVIHDLQIGTESTFGGSRDDQMPAFVPDFSGIVFVSDRAWGYRLWVQPLRAGQAVGVSVKLTDQPGTVANPAVSPDGRWVAYYPRVRRTARHLDRPDRRRAGAAVHEEPGCRRSARVVARTGTRLAFVSDRSGINQVWVSGVRDGRAVGDGCPDHGRQPRVLGRRRGRRTGSRLRLSPPAVTARRTWCHPMAKVRPGRSPAERRPSGCGGTPPPAGCSCRVDGANRRCSSSRTSGRTTGRSAKSSRP